MERTDRYRTAIWLNAIEPVFFTKEDRSSCFILVLQGSNLTEFARKNFPPEKIIILSSIEHIPSPSFHDILFKTDSAERLRNAGVRYVVVPHRSDERMERWAKEHGFHLIVTPWSVQKHWEDKKYFDRLLKRSGIASPRTIKSEKNIAAGTTYVIQEKGSFGLFGTKFHRGGIDPLPKTDPTQTLIREFAPGISVGISIFIDKDGNHFLSGLRRQCFEFCNGFPQVFLGVQWIPSDGLSEKARKNIEKEVGKIVSLLISRHFIGVANIDLLLDGDTPRIMECNPRLSSSTPQVFGVESLCTNKDAWEFFLNTFRRKKNKRIRNGHLPRHEFGGALLDIDVPAGTKVKNIPPAGVYRFSKTGITFVGLDMKDLSGHSNRFFLFHEFSDRGTIERDLTLATIISNFPLFDEKKGSLNKAGRTLFEHFMNSFLSPP